MSMRITKSPQKYSQSSEQIPIFSTLISHHPRTFFFFPTLWKDWQNASFLLILCMCLHNYTRAAVEVAMQEGGVGLRAKRLMTLSFSHLFLISVLMWSKLYCFAHRQAAPCHPSLSRHTSCPWRSLLKTDHWSSAKGLPRSGKSALLTFVCLTPNYDVLRHKGLLMALHVLNICTAPWSKDHLQQDPKYAHRK